MKQNITTFKTSLLLAGSLALAASCQDYEPFSEQQVQDRAYTREFERQFGEIDPNQDWDLFGQLAKGVHAPGTRAASADEVIITDPAGANITVSYDQAKAYQDMLPESNANGRTYDQTNLGRVTQDFISTAHTFIIAPIHWWTDGADEVGIYWYTDDPSEADVSVFGVDGNMYHLIRKKIYDGKTHLTGYDYWEGWEETTIAGSDAEWEMLVSYNQEKYILSDGTQVQTIQNNTPVYFEAGTKIVKTGNTGTYYTYDTTGQVAHNYDIYKEWGGTGYDNYESYVLSDLAAAYNRQGERYAVTDGTDTYKTKEGYTIYAGAFVHYVKGKTEKGNSDNNSLAWFESMGADSLESTPIKVEVPASVPYFGFYIRNSQFGTNNVGTRYSESNLNPTLPDWNYAKSHFVCTYNLKDLDPNAADAQFLCFEDWMANATNFDLNDVVFYVEGMDKDNIIDQEEINEQAILVCEDLNEFDFDFNDIVLGLNYKQEITRSYRTDPNTGKVTKVDKDRKAPQLIVTAMAAGGAFESTVKFKIKDGSEKEFGKIHALLGETSVTTATGHRIINAGATYPGDGIDTTLVKAELPDTILVDGKPKYATYLSQLFAEGFFKIYCTQGNADGKVEARVLSNKTQSDSDTYYDNDTNTSFSKAPQMMLLPFAFEWPQEMKWIQAAYDGFSDWVSDASRTDWIFDSQEPTLVTDRGEFTNVGDDVNVEDDPRYSDPLDLNVELGHTFHYVNEHDSTITDDYTKGSFISLNGVEINEGAKAVLKITYSKRPSTTIYLDDNYGDELFKDEFGQDVTSVSYPLSYSQLQTAIESGGIWVIARKQNGVEPEVIVSKAELMVTEGKSSSTTHNLTVEKTSVSFDRLSQSENLGATSSTGATITYRSSNSKVANVDASGNVTPVADGNAYITVMAEASGDYSRHTKLIPVSVSIIPDGFETSDKCTPDANLPQTHFTVPNNQTIGQAGKAKFAFNITGATAGTTVTVYLAPNGQAFSFNIEEGKTIYEIEHQSQHVTNLQWNSSLTLSELSAGTVNSVWVKAVQ